jgi:hypothetical protein
VNENLFFAAQAAAVCLPLALALAASGLPLLSAPLLFKPEKRVKVFRDKFGQQTATFCLLTGLCALAFLGGGAALVNMNFPAAASFWLAAPVPLFPLGAAIALAGALAAAYRASWQALKDNRSLHASIGLAASLCAFAAAYLFLVFFRHFAVVASSPGLDPSLMIPPPGSAAWIMLPGLLALCPALAGALAPLYLIHRRDKDDFGRDYYNYALKLAAKWALASTAVALLAQAALTASLWPAVRDLPVRSVFFWGQGAAFACFAMACALWGILIRHQNPLSLKPHAVCAAIMSLAALGGLAASIGRFYLG